MTGEALVSTSFKVCVLEKLFAEFWVPEHECTETQVKQKTQ